MNKQELAEKFRKDPRPYWSDESLSCLEKDIIPFEVWADSGTYTHTEIYRLQNPDNQELKDCNFTIKYLGDLYIGVTDEGKFISGDKTNDTLFNAELHLWNTKAEKLFNN